MSALLYWYKERGSVSELRSALEAAGARPGGAAPRTAFARPAAVALVGGGGKTSAMFGLARSYAASGERVLAGTTTRILDPNEGSEREGRGFGRVLTLGDIDMTSALDAARAAGDEAVVGSRIEDGKLYGIEPKVLDRIAALFDLVIVEADGSRGLPIKAPAPHEPVLPLGCRAVVGVVGLDALGRPMDERTVHRPQLFGPLVGCAPGQAIGPEHVARLAAAPCGLFKSSPPSAARIALLNKADAARTEDARECAEAVLATGKVDAVVVAAVGAEP